MKFLEEMAAAGSLLFVAFGPFIAYFLIWHY